MSYALPIRVLHSLIALATLVQLAIGELMTVPGIAEADEDEAGWILSAFAHEGHGDIVQPETLGFEVHEFLGLFIAALVLVRVLMAFSDMPGAGWRELFPWLTGEGRRGLAQEARSQMPLWKQGRLAPPEEGERLARTVHGFIILCMFGMAVTGAILFNGWNEHGHQTAFIAAVGELHEGIVGVLEVLLALHVLAVILHLRQGHNLLARIKPH